MAIASLSSDQLEPFVQDQDDGPVLGSGEFAAEVEEFRGFGKETTILEYPDSALDIPVYVNEFWTSKQRAAHSLHEI